MRQNRYRKKMYQGVNNFKQIIIQIDKPEYKRGISEKKRSNITMESSFNDKIEHKYEDEFEQDEKLNNSNIKEYPRHQISNKQKRTLQPLIFEEQICTNSFISTNISSIQLSEIEVNNQQQSMSGQLQQYLPTNYIQRQQQKFWKDSDIDFDIDLNFDLNLDPNQEEWRFLDTKIQNYEQGQTYFNRARNIITDHIPNADLHIVEIISYQLKGRNRIIALIIYLGLQLSLLYGQYFYRLLVRSWMRLKLYFRKLIQKIKELARQIKNKLLEILSIVDFY